MGDALPPELYSFGVPDCTIKSATTPGLCDSPGVCDDAAPSQRLGGRPHEPGRWADSSGRWACNPTTDTRQLQDQPLAQGRLHGSQRAPQKQRATEAAGGRSGSRQQKQPQVSSTEPDAALPRSPFPRSPPLAWPHCQQRRLTNNLSLLFEIGQSSKSKSGENICTLTPRVL